MAKAPTGGGKGNSKREGDELLWLETYFILFPGKRRPTLTQVERALTEANPRLRLKNLAADEDGLFASVLIESAEDNAAVEVSYEMGDAIAEQNMQWAKELQSKLTPKQLQLIVSADARLDVAHFERVPKGGAGSQPKPVTRDVEPDDFGAESSWDDDEFGEDEVDMEAAMEVFDPTCLLTVVDALQGLTKGLTFDPAAGEIV
ncbi:hypothetical protein [Lacipirellula limnantheis]|uniref:Uncharacterized protein n=1 Tax=Lacipirellula limnantheis TaxID=2528024 RepID=A0A517U358_9BACT|nr:hypothetical protein [Lacipirellula limnantheis]QDT75057.1 hypothetical protein I41_42660 [Lacipirellula limnantheis]